MDVIIVNLLYLNVQHFLKVYMLSQLMSMSKITQSLKYKLI